jgi:ABC-type nickel/cobalt efflux system permease component RcnA
MNLDPFVAAGIDLKVLIAGIAGGLVRWAVMPIPGGIVPNIVTVAVGALTAAYITPLAMHWLAIEIGAEESAAAHFQLAAAYLVGLTGQWVIRAAIIRAQNLSKVLVDSMQYDEPRRRKRHDDNDHDDDGIQAG